MSQLARIDLEPSTQLRAFNCYRTIQVIRFGVHKVLFRTLGRRRFRVPEEFLDHTFTLPIGIKVGIFMKESLHVAEHRADNFDQIAKSLDRIA
jgi:hypothetical protein